MYYYTAKDNRNGYGKSAGYGGGGRSSRRLSFKDIDPSRVEIVNEGVRLSTFNEKELIAVSSTSMSTKKSKLACGKKVDAQTSYGYESYCRRFYSSSITFGVSDSRTKEQVAKAFRHLIKICGGKEELF